MKKFNLPVTYSVWGVVPVEAETLEDAVRYYLEHQDELPLPELCDAEYIDGSDYIEGSMDRNSVEGIAHWLREFFPSCVEPEDE